MKHQRSFKTLYTKRQQLMKHQKSFEDTLHQTSTANEAPEIICKDTLHQMSTANEAPEVKDTLHSKF